MTRDELEPMNRKDLIALLPAGHGFNPIASRKADIIAAILGEPPPPAMMTPDASGWITLTEKPNAMRPVDVTTRQVITVVPPPAITVTNAPATTMGYGIILMVERDLFVCWTPLGGGRWRCESNARDQVEVVDGGADVVHNGQYLVLDGLMFDQHVGITEAFWDNTPLPPIVQERSEVR